MVQKLVDKAKENAPAVVEELIPEGLKKIGDIQKVLKRLLKEGIPIRDLGYYFRDSRRLLPSN